MKPTAKPHIPAKSQSAAKRPSNLWDRLAAPTTLMHELAAIAYATGAICLIAWTFAFLKH